MCKCIEGILRLLLFIFCVLLLSAGIVVMGVSGFIAAEFGKFAREDFFDQKFLFGVVGVGLVIGILLFLVGLFGIGGLCCKNKCMLRGFIVTLLILIVLEIVVMILVFVYRDEGEESAQENISRILREVYGPNSTNTTTRDVLDDLQRDFDCCGGFNLTDYTRVNIPLPLSCCRTNNCTAMTPETTVYYWDIGCGEKLFDEIGKLGVGVFVVAIVFAILQFLGIILACKYHREEQEGKHV